MAVSEPRAEALWLSNSLHADGAMLFVLDTPCATSCAADGKNWARNDRGKAWPSLCCRANSPAHPIGSRPDRRIWYPAGDRKRKPKYHRACIRERERRQCCGSGNSRFVKNHSAGAVHPREDGSPSDPNTRHHPGITHLDCACSRRLKRNGFSLFERNVENGAGTQVAQGKGHGIA